MEKYNFKDYMDNIFFKLIEENISRCQILGVNEFDFDIQLDNNVIPYVKVIRGTFVFDTKSYIQKSNIYDYFFITPDYFLYNLELDIDLGFLYSYYPLLRLKYNLVSDDYQIPDEVLDIFNYEIDWGLSSLVLLDYLSEYDILCSNKLGYLYRVLENFTISSDLKNYNFFIPPIVEVTSNYEMCRFMNSYKYLLDSNFKYGYCLLSNYKIFYEDGFLSYKREKIGELESLLSMELLLDKPIVSDYVFDFIIDDFDNFKLFYDSLLNLFTKYRVKSTVHIIVGKFLYSRKDKIRDYLEENKLSNFIISDF